MFKFNKKGQSLLEVIVAMAIFALISAALISLSTGGFATLQQGGEQIEADALATGGMESVRAIRDRAWNELTSTQNITENIDKYNRIINIEDVCRDISNQIADCPAGYTDIFSKKIISAVSWPIRLGVNNTVKQTSFLTNWDTKQWTVNNLSDGSASSTYFVSSSFNFGFPVAVTAISWQADISTCAGDCFIKMQVRTADDNNGEPVNWTDWFAAEDSRGSIISADLNWRQWAEFQVELVSDGNATPKLSEVVVYYK